MGTPLSGGTPPYRATAAWGVLPPQGHHHEAGAAVGTPPGPPQALPWSSFSDLSKRANFRGSSTTVNFLSRALMTSLARVCERTCRCLTVPRGR